MAKGGKRSKSREPVPATAGAAEAEAGASPSEGSTDAASSPVEAATPAAAAAVDQPVEPRSDSFASVTPEKPNLGLMEVHEAVTRYIDDHRYREAWNASIVKHASTLGYGPTATAEEWLSVFKSYGLKVKE